VSGSRTRGQHLPAAYRISPPARLCFPSRARTEQRQLISIPPYGHNSILEVNPSKVPSRTLAACLTRRGHSEWTILARWHRFAQRASLMSAVLAKLISSWKKRLYKDSNGWKVTSMRLFTPKETFGAKPPQENRCRPRSILRGFRPTEVMPAIAAQRSASAEGPVTGMEDTTPGPLPAWSSPRNYRRTRDARPSKPA